MVEPNNQSRAEWARMTLEFFSGLTRCDLEDALPDLLVDVLHLIHQDPEVLGFRYKGMIADHELLRLMDGSIDVFEEELQEEAEDQQ